MTLIKGVRRVVFSCSVGRETELVEAALEKATNGSGEIDLFDAALIALELRRLTDTTIRTQNLLTSNHGRADLARTFHSRSERR